MKNIYHSLLLVIAEATQKELARQIKYLKVENEILRSRLPARIAVTPKERQRLVAYYHTERPHQGRDNKLLVTAAPTSKSQTVQDDENLPSLGDSRCRSRLGGQLKSYHRKAA